MIHISRIFYPIDPNADRRLMQTLVAHSSSEQAREAAAVWIAAYDAALALGAAAEEAHLRADLACRSTAARSGLPVDDWRAAA